jgi:hypothetical protein
VIWYGVVREFCVSISLSQMIKIIAETSGPRRDPQGCCLSIKSTRYYRLNVEESQGGKKTGWAECRAHTTHRNPV